MQLEGVAFDWDRTDYPQMHFSEGTQMGLIAQDVERIIPEVVDTDGDGYKSIQYGKISALLIEAIKAQQKEIEGLRREVENIRNGY